MGERLDRFMRNDNLAHRLRGLRWEAMPDPADRRRFFKELLGEAAQSAREVHHSLGPMSPLNRLESLAALGQPDDDPFEDRPAWLDRATVPAKPAQRTCTLDDLELLAVSEGLMVVATHKLIWNDGVNVYSKESDKETQPVLVVSYCPK